MATINDLVAAVRESREILKGIAPSTVAGDLAVFSIGIPGAVTTKFSLPSRVFHVVFTSDSGGSIYGGFNSAASSTFFRITTAPKARDAFNLPGPLDLSTFHVYTPAALSGATLTAWVLAAAPLSS